MSQTTAGRQRTLVRSPIDPLRRSRRGLEERLLLSLPWLMRPLFSLALRRSPESRLRRAGIRRALRVGTAANNRGDYKVLSAFVSPEVEMHMFPDDPHGRADLDAVYHGRAGYLKVIEVWKAPFEEHRWDLQEVVDPGGAWFGARLEIVGLGGGSGIEVRQTQYGVWQIEDGMVRRQWAFAGEEAMLELLEAPETVAS